ncbi:MAG: hypothetical protein JXD23_01845 [Spirochaetales bacterium]|nr:hypothetical protein [Spirochaetales bacterium]
MEQIKEEESLSEDSGRVKKISSYDILSFMLSYKYLFFVFILIFQSLCLFSQSSNEWTTNPLDALRPKPDYLVTVAGLWASSFVVEDEAHYYRYHPWRAFDDDPLTAWNEGVKGPGIGEKLTLKLAQYIMIDKIVILPGYFDPKWYSANNRVKDCTIDVDGTREKCHFDDDMKPAVISFDFPVVFKSMIFTIEDVYLGNKYNDTCVSEIQFYYHDKRIGLNCENFVRHMEKVPGISAWTDPEGMYSYSSGMAGDGRMYFFRDGVFFRVYDNLGWSLSIEKGTWSREPANNDIKVSIDLKILVEGCGDYFSFPTGIRQYEKYEITETQTHEQFIVDWKREVDWAGQEQGGYRSDIDEIIPQHYKDVRENFRDMAEHYKLEQEKYYIETKKRRAAGELY